MVKLRKRVKLALIEDKAARKITFKKRRKGLLKKAYELSTLCNVKTCAIVYGPYEDEPETWPAAQPLTDLISKFKMLPEMNQTKRQVNLQELMCRRFKKGEERVKKLAAEKRDLEIRELMSNFMNGNDMSQKCYNLQDLIDFGSYLDKRLEDCNRVIGNHPKGAASGSSYSPAVPATAAPVIFNLQIRQDENVSLNHDPSPGVAAVSGAVPIQFPVTSMALGSSPMGATVSQAVPIGLYGPVRQYENLNLNQNQSQHVQYPVITMTPATTLTTTSVPEVVPMWFNDPNQLYLNPNSYQNHLAQIHHYLNLNLNLNQPQYVQFPVATSTPATTTTTSTVSQAIPPMWFYNQNQQYMNPNVYCDQLGQAHQYQNVNLNQNQQPQIQYTVATTSPALSMATNSFPGAVPMVFYNHHNQYQNLNQLPQYSNMNLNLNSSVVTTTTSPPDMMANTFPEATVPTRFYDQNQQFQNLNLNQNQLPQPNHYPNTNLNQNQLGQVQYPMTNATQFSGPMTYGFPGTVPIGSCDNLQQYQNISQNQPQEVQYPVTTAASTLSPMATHGSAETTPLSFGNQLPQSMNMNDNGKQMEDVQLPVATMSPDLTSSPMAAVASEASSVRFPNQINQNQNQLENAHEFPITPQAPTHVPSPIDFYGQFQQGNEDENSNHDLDQNHEEWVREMLESPPKMESNEELMRFPLMEDNQQNQVNNDLPATSSVDKTGHIFSISSTSADGSP